MNALLALILAILAATNTEAAMADPRNPSGVTGAALPQPRAGAPVTVEQALVALYTDAAQQVNLRLAAAIESMQRVDARPSSEYASARLAQLSADLRAILARTAAAGATPVRDAMQDARTLGLRQAVVQAEELGIDTAARAMGARHRDAMVREGVIETMAQDTAARLNNALAGHAAQAATLFRTLGPGPLSAAEPEVNRALVRGIVMGDPRAADRALRDLFRDPNAPEAQTYRRIGAQQITVGGWTGPVRAYTMTVVRTRTREATVAARHEALPELGIEYVQITGRVSKNFCTRFIGLVCVLGPARDGFPSIHDLPEGGPPFHPNCSKGTAAYVPELVSSARSGAASKAVAAFERDRAAGVLTDNLTT